MTPEQQRAIYDALAAVSTALAFTAQAVREAAAERAQAADDAAMYGTRDGSSRDVGI